MNPCTKTFAQFTVLFLRTVLVLTFWLGTITAQPKKPNILIFMADDMGIGDTSAYLGINLMPSTKAIVKTLKTPNVAWYPQPISCAFTSAAGTLQQGDPGRPG